MLDRIPYEIFSNIIKISYQYFSITGFLSCADQSSIPPMEASHVCHSWRVALLSNPTMWTCIRPKFHGGDEAELREMISRSGSSPLDVFIDKSGYWPDPSHSTTSLTTTLPLVFREVHRFRKLYIQIPVIFTRQIFRHLKQPAPMLQYFYFELTQLYAHDLSDIFRKAYPDLFLGNAPSLRHVHLHISAGLGELESTSMFKNLSTLQLLFLSPIDINGDILLDTLRLSPCLRTLNIFLSPYLGSRIVTSTPLNHHASLPYLQELRLEGCVSSNIDFILGHLKFPADKVRFAINCNNFPDTGPLLHFLSQRRLPLLSPSIDCMTFNLYENIDLSSATSSHSAESSVLSLDYTPSVDIMPSLRRLKLSDITHMHLEMIPAGFAVLKEILPLLENLLHLRVLHGFRYEDNNFYVSLIPESSVLKALVPRLQKPTSQTQPIVEESPGSDMDSDVDSSVDPSNDSGSTTQRRILPCPSLHTLEIVFTAEPFFEQFVELYFKRLARCCQRRGQNGHPIKYVSVLCKSQILAEEIKAWLQANGELDWSESHVEVQ